MSVGRPPSSVSWNSFAYCDDPKHACCLLCGHIIKATGPPGKESISTSSMGTHLDYHRASTSFRELVLPGSRNDVESRARASTPSSAAPAKKQLTLAPPITVPPATITATILEIIAFGMLPFAFAANPSLQRLLHLFQPSYKVPDRTTFSRKAEERYKALLAEEKAFFTVHGSRGSSLQVRACVCLSVFRSAFSFLVVRSSITGLSL
jgi:hypothetical protein